MFFNPQARVKITMGSILPLIPYHVDKRHCLRSIPAKTRAQRMDETSVNKEAEKRTVIALSNPQITQPDMRKMKRQTMGIMAVHGFNLISPLALRTLKDLVVGSLASGAMINPSFWALICAFFMAPKSLPEKTLTNTKANIKIQ